MQPSRHQPVQQREVQPPARRPKRHVADEGGAGGAGWDAGAAAPMELPGGGAEGDDLSWEAVLQAAHGEGSSRSPSALPEVPGGEPAAERLTAYSTLQELVLLASMTPGRYTTRLCRFRLCGVVCHVSDKVLTKVRRRAAPHLLHAGLKAEPSFSFQQAASLGATADGRRDPESQLDRTDRCGGGLSACPRVFNHKGGYCYTF